MTCLSVSPCRFVLHRTYQNRKRPEKKGREPSGTEAWEDRTQEIVLLENDAKKETIMFINRNYPSKQVRAGTFFTPPVSFSDICVGPEREGFLSGFIQRKEGQQAEMSRNRPGTEEGGVCPTWEPAQEGYSELLLLENYPLSACFFWTKAVWNQSCWIASKWDVTVRVWHRSWSQIVNR